VYGFLGRNGAGKTTTIRMLMGIIRPDGGTIELFGEPTRRTTIAQKRRIGYVSQGQFFYPWMTCRTLGRFVAGFYPAWDDAEFDRLLRVLDVPWDRKVSALSSGTRVKLALALALAHRPEVLILDEPTAGLDPVARREFLEMIGRQARTHHRTTLFSSHLVDEVERIADRVGIIHKGRLCYEGSIPTLRQMVRRIRMEDAIVAELFESATTADDPGRVASRAESDVIREASDAETLGADAAPLAQLVSQAASVSPSPPGVTRSQLDRALATRKFRVLREESENGTTSVVIAGPPEAWDAGAFPKEAVTTLSLEDIFIAMASEAIAEL
jgi:ABC-type multidrug transport system ATPase subunit